MICPDNSVWPCDRVFCFVLFFCITCVGFDFGAVVHDLFRECISDQKKGNIKKRENLSLIQAAYGAGGGFSCHQWERILFISRVADSTSRRLSALAVATVSTKIQEKFFACLNISPNPRSFSHYTYDLLRLPSVLVHL